MSTFIVDGSNQSWLAGLKEPTQIVDATGRVLGVFTPSPKFGAVSEEVRQLFDPEELKRRKERLANQPAKTLREVVDGLQRRFPSS